MDIPLFLLRFVLAILATWRVSHLIAAEDGPADVIIRLRVKLGHSLAGRLMDCFNCLSLWIAAPAALFVTRDWAEWLMVWLAVSGAACLLHRIGAQQLPMVVQAAGQMPQTHSPHRPARTPEPIVEPEAWPISANEPVPDPLVIPASWARFNEGQNKWPGTYPAQPARD